MNLTVLGCGTYISGPEKCASGFLLEGGSNSIVLDLGFGALKNLQKVESPPKINALFFTHMHLDHVADLAPFLFHRYGLVNRRLSVPLQINIFGPKGMQAHFDSCKAIWPHIGMQNRIVVKEMEYGREKIFGFTVSSKPVKPPQSIGYRVEFGGKALAYSGDTGNCQEVIDLGKNADLLILECNFLDEKTSDEHLNAEECGKIAEQAGSKKMLLTHLLPETEKKKKEAIKRVKEHFSGKIKIAKDLMQVKI